MIAKNPGVPAGGDCELLQVLLRVNERVFRPAGGRDGLSGCFAMFYVIQTASLTAWQFRRCAQTAPRAALECLPKRHPCEKEAPKVHLTWSLRETPPEVP